MEHNLTTKEALLHFLDQVDRSNLKSKHKVVEPDKLSNIRANVDNIVGQMDHINNAMNVYKLILFTSRNRDEFEQNLKVMIRPDGLPYQFTPEQMEELYQESKTLQLFFIMLELSRQKCERLQPTQEDWDKVKQNANHFYDKQFEKMINTHFLDENYEHDEQYNIQTGGNRNRMVKICYKMNKPVPLILPRMEFLNFRLEHENNSICLDVEWPWWPTLENMLPELFNKGSIKQCMRTNCVEKFKDMKLSDSPEKQQCVESCFQNAEPSFFDFIFFPLWVGKKYDPFGVITTGLEFTKFSLNSMDQFSSMLEPLNDLAGYIFDAIGIIPIIGDALGVVKTTFDLIYEYIGMNLTDLINALIGLQEKDFEQAFLLLSKIAPGGIEKANTMQSLDRFVDTFLDSDITKNVIAGANTAVDAVARVNPVNLLASMVRAHTKDQESKAVVTELSNMVDSATTQVKSS